jgi:hypothetical protein
MSSYALAPMRRTLLFAAPLLLAAARVAQACPNCKEGAGNEAFQWGILLMIGGVITVVGSLAVFIARPREQRRDGPEKQLKSADPGQIRAVHAVERSEKERIERRPKEGNARRQVARGDLPGPHVVVPLVHDGHVEVRIPANLEEIGDPQRQGQGDGDPDGCGDSRQRPPLGVGSISAAHLIRSVPK